PVRVLLGALRSPHGGLDRSRGKRGHEQVARLLGWAQSEGRLEAIRGRRIKAGLPGIRGLPLHEFLDLVWAEIWDDCPPLGDHAQYRSFVTQMFVEAKPYEAISYTDTEGKVHK